MAKDKVGNATLDEVALACGFESLHHRETRPDGTEVYAGYYDYESSSMAMLLTKEELIEEAVRVLDTWVEIATRGGANFVDDSVQLREDIQKVQVIVEKMMEPEQEKLNELK